MKLSPAQNKVLALIDDGYTIHGSWEGVCKHGASARKGGSQITLSEATLSALSNLGFLRYVRPARIGFASSYLRTAKSI